MSKLFWHPDLCHLNDAIDAFKAILHIDSMYNAKLLNDILCIKSVNEYRSRQNQAYN